MAEPTIRCRCPNSECVSGERLGSPGVGWLENRTLAISVDLSRFLASVKLYERLASRPKAKIFRSWPVTLTLYPSDVLSST